MKPMQPTQQEELLTGRAEGVRVSSTRPAAAAALAFALALALAFALPLSTALSASLPQAAFAATEDENLVDPTQRADNSFIYDTTIESLFEQASLFDNRTVQVIGEVIGDRIVADEGNCWITLTVTDSEDKSSISVLMSNELANQIDCYGKYGVIGTTLQVRGTYHQACTEHDGLPDIHATNSSVVSKGIVNADQFDSGSFIPGIMAVLAGGVLMAAFYIARERTR